MMPKTVVDGKVTSWEFGEAGKVDDVQVNGMSVLSNKVANIPIAGDNSLGVVMVADGTHGLNRDVYGRLKISEATSNAIKLGNIAYTPITPVKQHKSTFYGLAKVAGHDEKDSELPVGTYTDEAKAAIQSMLGIDSAIADAISDITSFEFQVVTELPATGTKGVIYLVAHTHDENDVYDEYIWITDRYERLGTLDIDLSNYVTFDDYAKASKGGVVKVAAGDHGLTISNNGYISTYPATSVDIKTGTNNYRQPAVNKQHEATFYGLAKAAGADMKNSANPVGTYTEEAKVAIRNMIDATGESASVTVTGTDPVIQASRNTRYICGEILSLDFTPCASGICEVIFTSGSSVTVLTLPETIKMPEWFEVETNHTYEISVVDGVYGAVMVW